MSSSKPASETRPFWSSHEELLANENHSRARRSWISKELDVLISEQHAARKKPLSWHHNPDQSFPEWKEDFTAKLRDTLLIPGVLGLPSDPVVKERIDHGDYIEEHVEITLTPPFRTTAIVTIPKNGAKKHPTLVALHCFGGMGLYGKEKMYYRPGEAAYMATYRQECYQGVSVMDKLSRAGFLCIAIDAFGHGTRTTMYQQDPEGFEKQRTSLDYEGAFALTLRIMREEYELHARTLGAIGRSIAAVTATDDMRTVDYLMTRNDVDTSRIGCFGLSFGSFRSHYLGTLDERVRAVTSCCWISSLAGIVDYNVANSLGFFAVPDGLYRDYDMTDIPAASAPKPFLGISGWQDILMEPRGVAQAHLTLRRAWEAADSPDTLGSLVYDAPHELNPEMQDRMIEFFRKHL